MIKKGKIMTALVLTVVMVAGNAMSAFAATRTASGRGYALYVDVYAKATVTTTNSQVDMVGEGSGSGSKEVYKNVKINYVYYKSAGKKNKISGTLDKQVGSLVTGTETEKVTYTWNSGSMVSCNVITYVGLSKSKCNTTGAVAQIVY